MNIQLQTPLIWNEKKWYFLSVFYAREKWNELIIEIMNFYRIHTGLFCNYLFSFSGEKGEHIQVTFASFDISNDYTNEIQTRFQKFTEQCPSKSTIQFPYGKTLWSNYPNNSLIWNKFRLPNYSEQYISFHQQTMRVALNLMEDDFSEDTVFSITLYLMTKSLDLIDANMQRNILSHILQEASTDSPNEIDLIKKLINEIDTIETREAIESYRNEIAMEDYSTELLTSWLNEAKIILNLYNFNILWTFICQIIGLTESRRMLILFLLKDWFNLKISDEKRKMLIEGHYNPDDEKLKEERLYTQKLLHQFNGTEELEHEKRYLILKKLLGSSENNITIESSFQCDYGKNIFIGEDFFANYNCVLLDACAIVIGDNCLLGPGVHIYTSTHPVNPEERVMKKLYRKPVVIGNNVWIGGNSIINPGVTIGDNSVVASGSVVVKDVPCNVLVGGNPAKVIREI
jgi:maltose O-acetyltransferase